MPFEVTPKNVKPNLKFFLGTLEQIYESHKFCVFVTKYTGDSQLDTALWYLQKMSGTARFLLII